MRPQIYNFFCRQLKHEAFRESLDVALHLFVEAFGWNALKQGWEIEIVKLRTAPGEEPMGATYHINGGTRLEITMDQMDKPAAGEYPNASVEVGLVFNGDGEPRVETLTLPMRLVVGA